MAIHFYNENKVGVDSVDQMARMYSTHSASRRWPLAVWANILDLTCINAWIIFKEATQQPISRRNFLLQLIEELRGLETLKQVQPLSVEFEPSKKRRKCQQVNCRNCTSTICRQCKKMTCGNCSNGEKLTLVMCNICNDQ